MSLNLSKGVWYMIYASFAFSLMNVCIKYIPHIPPIEIVLFRSVVSLVISLFFLLNQRVPIWGNNKKVLFLRGFTGAIALTLFFMLLQQIPLAAATSMQYMAPIFTAVLGIFIVKEKVANRQFLYFGLSLLGILVIQGFDTRISLFHLLLGLITSIFTGLAYNFIRKLKTSEHPLVIIFYFPLVTIPFAAIYAYFNWVNPIGWDWLILILVGLLTQVAQYFMTKSYQAEELSKVSIIQYVGIIYALGFGYFIFDETYNWLTYIGMILVFSGVILNLWNKRNT